MPRASFSSIAFLSLAGDRADLIFTTTTTPMLLVTQFIKQKHFFGIRKFILIAKKQPNCSSSGAPAEAAEATCATSLTRQLHMSAQCSFLAGCFSLRRTNKIVFGRKVLSTIGFFIKHKVIGI